MLVISAIVMLTMIAVEFAYNAQIEYRMAIRQKERLQAYYLANSAYNLTRLELKLGSQVQSRVAGAISQSGIDIGIDLSSPLCQQFPIKTALFRLLMTGETGSESPTVEGEEPPEPKPGEEVAAMMGGMSLSGLDEFLQFEGDFDSECVDESSKVDLNFIYSQNPLQPAAEGTENGYDQYKRFIMGIIGGPGNEDLIKKADVKVLEVVRNIADWIDPNEVINDFGGIEGGGEDNVYRNNAPGQMAAKNGKLSIPEDIFMVEGIKDGWWNEVSDLFTIYGITSQQGKPQINVCRAPNEVVKVLILRYTETRADLPPLKSQDIEILDQL
ncbi:MAG: type II secretion system protein GspK, partial [bacterium]|nr:type II secretion system protein GspK [bacterium]